MARKRYLCKVYRSGAFAGLLPQPTNEIAYSQDINTGGPQMVLQIPATLGSAGAAQVLDIITDESGNNIVDQNGQPIYARVDYVFNNIPIDLNNRVVVYCYYANNPNGIVVFDGLISDWEADKVAGTIKLTLLGYGVQLDNYLIAVVPGTPVLQQIATTTHFNAVRSGVSATYSNPFLGMGQTFQLASPARVSGINIWASKESGYTGTPTARMTLQLGIPGAGGQVITSVARPITTYSYATSPLIPFIFPAPVDLLSSVTYSFSMTVENTPPETSVGFGMVLTNPYAGGQEYQQSYVSGWTTTGTYDMTFQIIAGDGNAYGKYLSQDPSAILMNIIDNYQGFGGVIDYTTATIDTTGSTVSYTFKGNTVYEGVQKVLEMSPGNWYWYIDPGTNLLHFHRAASVPAHKFYVGVHISSLNIGQTLDNMKNRVYFSGGDTGGGVNLVGQYSNPRSTGQYGNWLQREADSRVTLESTAATISRGVLNQYSDPVFQTEVTIPAAVYDIETIKLGQMVAFRNADSFTNGLLLQIVGLNKKPNEVTLRLATNPPSVAHRIEDIRRNVDNLYTTDNPET